MRLRLSRDDRLWHLKSPYLAKSREPKPTNSAYAEFANQNAGSIDGFGTEKTPTYQKPLAKAPKKNAGFKGGNRQTIPRIRLRRILKFWHRAFAQGRAVPVPKRLSLIFDYF